MTQIAFEEVTAIRARIAAAHSRAAAQFRDTFVLGQTPPTAHLEMLATALLAGADGIRAHGRAYQIEGGMIVPLYENFYIDRTPVAIFEYWLIISEITGSDSWRMTRVIASPAE